MEAKKCSHSEWRQEDENFSPAVSWRSKSPMLLVRYLTKFNMMTLWYDNQNFSETGNGSTCCCSEQGWNILQWGNSVDKLDDVDGSFIWMS